MHPMRLPMQTYQQNKRICYASTLTQKGDNNPTAHLAYVMTKGRRDLQANLPETEQAAACMSLAQYSIAVTEL